MRRRIVIMGASSGMGAQVAKIFISKGYVVGLAARREENLKEIQSLAPERVFVAKIDITKEDATSKLHALIEQIGGMDIYFNATGIGWENLALNQEQELKTVQTNVVGFTRMLTSVYNYFKSRGQGHIAVISSIAGTKGMGAAPSYSATKKFENCYIDALEQLSHLNKVKIAFTDIRPGFVATDLLDKDKKYPLLMSKDKVSKAIVRAIEHKKRKQVIDWKYRILVFFWKLIPQCIWKKMPIAHQ